MNEVSQWLRSHVQLAVDSKRLGIANHFDPDLARLAFLRAAEEIDGLTKELDDYRRRHPATGF